MDDADIRAALTGLCTFLVQSDAYEDGDTVEVSFRYDRQEETWLPLRAAPPNQTRTELHPDECQWGGEAVLVRTTLVATGGQPRDSMNQPAEEYDPEALTLSNVRVVDRSYSRDEATTTDDE